MEPKKSLRLQVLERVKEVLCSIDAGSGKYFYTPASVSFRFQHWSEIGSFPAYMISAASGGRMEASASAQPEIEYTEDYYVSIKAVVRAEDTVTALENTIQDIRTAILEDARNSDPESLGGLTILVEMEEPPITDDGYLSLEGYAFCDLRVKFTILNYY